MNLDQSPHDLEYLDCLEGVLRLGEHRPDRTGVGTIGVFAEKMCFDLSDGTFPLLTTKRVHWRSIVYELLWFLRGDTNVRWLNEHGVSIWDEWADGNGELGPVYGKQWRSWAAPDGRTIDQLARLIEALRSNPFSRRHVVSAWNVADVDDMALPPCHLLFQFYVCRENHRLHCQLYQRSADMFLGVPFNVASYSLLLCILADTLGFNRGTFHWIGGDTHVYENHVEQVREQLSRLPRPAPRLERITVTDPLAVTFEDVKLVGYDPLPRISAPVAV